jgi:hypothetical protein
MTAPLTAYDRARRCRDGRGYLCSRNATHAIRAPDQTVHGYMCAQHATEVVEEYQEKLAEYWTAEPLFNLQPISPREPRCSVQCCVCGVWHFDYADLAAKAFAAYYCEDCARKVQDDLPPLPSA